MNHLWRHHKISQYEAHHHFHHSHWDDVQLEHIEELLSGVVLADRILKGEIKPGLGNLCQWIYCLVLENKNYSCHLLWSNTMIINHIHKNQMISIIIQLVVLSECLESSFVFFFVVELPDLTATFSWWSWWWYFWGSWWCQWWSWWSLGGSWWRRWWRSFCLKWGLAKNIDCNVLLQKPHIFFSPWVSGKTISKLFCH